MSNASHCQSCRHFLELPMGNDPKLYFCANPQTKEGPRPIGFIMRDAPACALHESLEKEPSSQRTVIFMVAPQEASHDQAGLIETKAVRFAVLASTLIGLAGWLGSHIPHAIISSLMAKLGF